MLKIIYQILLCTVFPRCRALESVESGPNLHASLVQLKQLWQGEIEAIRVLENVLQQTASTQSTIQELVISPIGTTNYYAIQFNEEFVSQIPARFQKLESTSSTEC